MAVKNLLKKSELDNFSKFIEKDGYTTLKPTSEHELLRAKNISTKDTLVIYNVKNKDYCSVMDKDLNIVTAYLNQSDKSNQSTKNESLKEAWKLHNSHTEECFNEANNYFCNYYDLYNHSCNRHKRCMNELDEYINSLD